MNLASCQILCSPLHANATGKRLLRSGGPDISPRLDHVITGHIKPFHASNIVLNTSLITGVAKYRPTMAYVQVKGDPLAAFGSCSNRKTPSRTQATCAEFTFWARQSSTTRGAVSQMLQKRILSTRLKPSLNNGNTDDCSAIIGLSPVRGLGCPKPCYCFRYLGSSYKTIHVNSSAGTI